MKRMMFLGLAAALLMMYRTAVKHVTQQPGAQPQGADQSEG